MPDMNGWQLVVSGLGIGGAAWLAKVIFPVLKSGWESSTANNRAEKDMIDRLQLDISGYREREAGYMKMATEMSLIKYQLELANQKIAELTSEIQALKGIK